MEKAKKGAKGDQAFLKQSYEKVPENATCDASKPD